jgi:succinoglycan biosynthesis transport protein ExoP
MNPSTNLQSVNQYGPVTRPASPSWIVPNRPPTPWASLKAHKRLALTVIIAVTIFGFAIAMLFGRVYVAEATIRVSPVLPASVDIGESPFNSSVDYRDFVQQQVFEIDNYATASAALDLLGPKRSLWQHPGESDRFAAERLVASLKVDTVPDSYLITIGMSGAKPDGLADIVNAVAKAYLSNTAKRELDGADIGFQLFTSREAEIEKNIANDQQQLAGLTQELGMTSVEGVLVNPYDKMLADTNGALAHARRNVVVAQAHLDAVKSHRERIKDAEVEARAEQVVAASGSDSVTARQQLIQQREQALVELSQLGPNHPGRPALEAEISTTNKELARLDQSSLDRARSMMSDSEQATTKVDISEAESNLDQMQSAEQGIEKEFESLKVEAMAYGTKYSQAVTVHDRLDREHKDLQDVLERMSLLRLKSQAPGAVSLESAAMVPDMPRKSTRRMTFAVFVLTALLLGIVIPTLIDLTDRKIKTIDEYEAILGFPPLGVAMGSNGNSGPEPLRRIAFGIMREWRTSGIRSYILTSVREGSNTALSLALAEELTEMGVRTLAIEASLSGSNPRQLRAPTAVSAASSGSARATKRLVPLVANTSVLDAKGQPTTNGDSKLQRVQDGVARSFGFLRESVDRALGNHDIVLLSAPPLLASADTIAMIQMPAGAILVARAGRDEVPDIASAVRELEKCVPPVVGAIMCGDAHRMSRGDDGFDTEFHAVESSDRGYHYSWMGKRL